MTPAIEYAPTPTGVPADLARPSRRYRLQVGIVLVSLILFFLFYLFLIVGSAYLCYWAWVFPIKVVNKGTVAMKVVTIGASALLFLFLLKGLFKWQRESETMRVEITEAEQPRLFAFIRRLCAETGAPFPRRVFLSPDVNASVFYNSSVLSLVLPTRKNLLIGLGLVNVLNLSEFKAVLAHEFGHFSQTSMKLGGYVYVSNRIAGDIVYGRDRFDDLLSSLKSIDIRAAVFVWGFYGVQWVLRKVLEGCFRAINFCNSALSRQMEFNADLVAASVTGSDALVHALARLDVANQALMGAAEDLNAAADHRLYTRDLFHHQTQSLGFIRKLRKDPKLGEPPVLPPDPQQKLTVFEPGDDGIPLMWATHPSNFDREENLKRHYVRSPIDGRSAWLLFDNPAAVKQQVTECYYQVSRKLDGTVEFSHPETVQAFIDDEHAEMTYGEQYHTLYDSRYLEPGNVQELIAEATRQPWATERLAGLRSDLYGAGLKDWTEKHDHRTAEFELLSGLDQGDLRIKGRDFEFRGSKVRAGDVHRLLEMVDGELTADRQWLADLDKKVFLAHYQMARSLGPAVTGELVERYEFHLAVQEILRNLAGEKGQIDAALKYLSDNRELGQADFAEIVRIFSTARQALESSLRTASGLRMPALKNMQPGQALGPFLLEKPLVPPLYSDQSSLDGKWIGAFLEQMSEVADRVKRIHFKSLGGLLALQEKTCAEWANLANLPEVVPVSAGAS